MTFFIKNFFLNLFFIFLLNIYLLQLFKEKNKVRCSRIFCDKRFRKSNYFNCKYKYDLIKASRYNHLFINNREIKRNKRSYKFRKHKMCSIFSIFKNKKNKENKKEGCKQIIENENKNKNIDSKRVNTNKNILDNNEKKKDNLARDLDKNNAKNSKLSGIVENLNTKSEKNSNNLNDGINRKEINSENIFKENSKNHNEKIIIKFKDTDLNSSKILKNTSTYKIHLENLKEKAIISLNKIFCSYTKSVDKKDDFKCFFMNIFKNFEISFHNYSMIKDIEKISNEKIKKEFILYNLNCFIEIINMIEESLFNILVFKIQFLKVNTINEIKDIISSKQYSIDYNTFSNNINHIVQKYERQLNNLYPEGYEFPLYNNILENYNLLLEFSYKLPMHKYKEFIETNIHDVKNFSQDLINKKKKNLYKEMERNKSYQNILQIIDNQQKQIEVLQEQLESSIEGINGKYSPFHCAVAYRIPDTNLNISTQYLKGKFNVKLNCIPDDSQHLLGSYGFVKSLPFGNLGLSFSLNF